MNKKLPAWIVLTVISLVAALALGATYNGTKDRIAAQEAEKAVAVRQELLPQAVDFEQIAPEGENEVFKGVDADGNAVGYVSVGTVTGFGGPVEVTVGMDGEGTLTGVRVGGANFSETAGLGAKSKEPAFYEQFAGKTYPVDLSKNGGEVDAITAATITSSAVVRGVNETAKYIAEAADIKLAEPVVAIEELGDNRYGTTAQGVSGPFPVVVTLDETGAVTGVEVQDTASANDISYLSRVQGNEAYLSQFVGQTAVNAADLDTVSGATISSSSVNGAVSKILLYVNDPAAYAALTAAEADVPDVSIPEGAATYTATGKGLTGTFDVTISVDENAAVTGIEVGDASIETDVPFLGQVKDNARFLAQFIGTAGNVKAEDIDLVTGATISSNGVIDAVNKAWNESQGIVDEPAPTEAPAAPAAEGNTVTAKGLTGSFPVTVELNDDGTVKAVTLGKSDSDMDQEFLNKLDDAFLAQFAGKALPVEADIASGATISSNAVIEAVNSFATAEPAAAPAAEGNTVTAKGLTGSFPVTVELNEDGTVKAVTLGSSDSDMDASFLAMVNNDAFLGQFVGKTLPVEGIDAVTGATTSSKAIVEAVNSFAAAEPETKSETPAVEAPTAPTAVSGETVTAKGLTGSFPVTVELNEDGTVKDVTLGSSDSDMDASFLAMVNNDAFLGQFVGKTLPVEGIDAVTGATTSSKAIIEAVNSYAAAPAIQNETPETPEAPALSGDLKNGQYENFSMGMNAPITVLVTIRNGAVADVTVADSANEYDAPYVKKVQDAAFLNQFKGLTAAVEERDIDLVSGATVSSRAVLNAVNLVIAAAAPEKDAAETAETPAEVPETTEEVPAVTGGLKDGTYENFSMGMNAPVTVVVKVQNGVVSSVTVEDSANEYDAPFVQKVQDEEFLGQFIGRDTVLSEMGAEAVSGATVSSRAVLNAVNLVIAAAAPETAETAEAPEIPAETPETPEEVPAVTGGLKDGTYENFSMGMNAPVTVVVTVENGVVSDVTVQDSANEYDAPFVQKVQDEEFLGQFIGRDTVLSEMGAEAVSGATVSSRAVLNAVNLVIAAAAPETAETAEAPEIPAEPPETPEEVPAVTGDLKDGVYETFSMGMNAPVTVLVKVQNGVVSDVTVQDSANEYDAPYVQKVQDEAFLSQFAGLTAAVQEQDIDLVSGATVSGRAVLRAVDLVIDHADQ